MSGPRGLHLSGTQVIASVLATLTGAIAASYLGVAGTLIGAALGSIASTMGTEIYRHYLLRSQEGLKSAGEILVHRTTGEHTATQHPATEQTATQPNGATTRGAATQGNGAQTAAGGRRERIRPGRFGPIGGGRQPVAPVVEGGARRRERLDIGGQRESDVMNQMIRDLAQGAEVRGPRERAAGAGARNGRAVNLDVLDDDD